MGSAIKLSLRPRHDGMQKKGAERNHRLPQANKSLVPQGSRPTTCPLPRRTILHRRLPWAPRAHAPFQTPRLGAPAAGASKPVGAVIQTGPGAPGVRATRGLSRGGEPRTGFDRRQHDGPRVPMPPQSPHVVPQVPWRRACSRKSGPPPPENRSSPPLRHFPVVSPSLGAENLV